MKTLLLIVLSFLIVLTSISQTTSTFTSSGSWLCPAGVTSIQVEAWGAGGAGGNGGTSNQEAGGGGGGGGYSKNTTVTVVPGITYTITIGAGGLNGAAIGDTGNNGGQTTATFGVTTVSANGGFGGVGGEVAGGAGGAGGTGSSYDGGVGGTGNSGTGRAGGGGEGAGTTVVGGSAVGGVGGSGTDGGDGATSAAAANSSAGVNATLVGGGGSGSVKNFAAGDGYTGQMILTYTCPGEVTADAGPDQTLSACATTATLAGNIPSYGIGTWTVVSGTATITSVNSPTSGLTGLVPGAAATLRWTISNGVCGSTNNDVIITAVTGVGCWTYCASTGTTNTAGYVSQVQFNTIDRSSVWDGGYYDASGTTTTVWTESSYDLTLTRYNAGYNLYTAAWIDFNNDGDFVDAGENIMTSALLATVGNVARTVSVSIPANATLGSTRLRVMMKYNAAITGPCENNTYQETEDFTVSISSCTAPTVQASSLTTSSITATAMTVGWTRGNGSGGVVVIARASSAVNSDAVSNTTYSANAAFGSGDQVGTGNYVIYKGTGTSVNLTALSALTTYHFAVYEYNTTSTCFLNSELTGNATTLAATYTSTSTGNWNAAGTWVGGVVPTANENVVIANGHTVTITAAAACNNLTVGEGTSGILIYEATTARTLTVGGDLTIASGGTFQSAATGTQTSHSLSIAGSITNNGTLDFSTNSNTAAAGITFTGSSNTTFSGTGGTTDLKTLTINKGTSETPVLELSPSNFSIQGVTTDVAGFLTLTNGTFKISGSFTMTNRIFTTAAYTIGSTCKFHLNNSNFTVAAQAANARYDGGVEVDAGTYNVGINSDDNFNYGSTTSTFTLDGGAVNVAGQFVGIVGQYIVYTQTGGTLSVCTVGNTFDASGSFYIPSSGNTFNMSGGTIICRLASTATPTPRDYNNSAATRSITGGTLQLGDASSGVAKTFVITGYMPNLLVTNTSGNHTAKLYSLVTPYIYLTTILQTGTTLNTSSNTVSATFNGDITIGTSASFLSGTGTQTINANWVNNGTLTPSTGTISFTGVSAQTISGSSTTSFYNLTVANTSGGVSLAVNSTVTNTLTLTSGKLTIQGYTLAIGTGSANGSISGASSSNYIVAYDNSGTIGYLKRFVNSNAAYSYPIGDATNYTPLTFTLTSATLSNAYLTVYTKDVKVPGLNSAITTYLDRYWNVTESGFTTPTYDISYTYVDADLVGSETGMLPIKKSGSTWYKPTGSTFSTGTAQGIGSFNAGTNTLTWTGLSTFSGFGGVPDGAVTLPIEMLSFSGQKLGKNNELKWKTASEINNDFFTLEKATDGENFEIVGNKDGAGNSTGYIDYLLIDYNVRPIINYYRLKQTDFDGKYTVSEIIAIDNSLNETAKEIVTITNILGQEVNEFYRGIVVILYADGTSIKVIQ